MKARIPNDNQGGNMMQKLQKMQEEMTKTQTAVEESEFSASVGGGAVEVRVSGKHEILGITVKPEVVDPDDIETLEDLVVAAVNEAIKKVNADSDAEMGKVTGALGGMGFPGLF